MSDFPLINNSAGMYHFEVTCAQGFGLPIMTLLAQKTSKHNLTRRILSLLLLIN